MGPADSLSHEHNIPDLAGSWAVVRHGGRRLDTWRVKHLGKDEAAARKAYARIDIRQGGLRLVAPDGRIVQSEWAPRLRTRW